MATRTQLNEGRPYVNRYEYTCTHTSISGYRGPYQEMESIGTNTTHRTARSLITEANIILAVHAHLHVQYGDFFYTHKCTCKCTGFIRDVAGQYTGT